MNEVYLLDFEDCEYDYSDADRVLITAPGLQQIYMSMARVCGIGNEDEAQIQMIDDGIYLRLTPEDGQKMMEAYMENWFDDAACMLSMDAVYNGFRDELLESVKTRMNDGSDANGLWDWLQEWENEMIMLRDKFRRRNGIYVQRKNV